MLRDEILKISKQDFVMQKSPISRKKKISQFNLRINEIYLFISCIF